MIENKNMITINFTILWVQKYILLIRRLYKANNTISFSKYMNVVIQMLSIQLHLLKQKLQFHLFKWELQLSQPNQLTAKIYTSPLNKHTVSNLQETSTRIGMTLNCLRENLDSTKVSKSICS